MSPSTSIQSPKHAAELRIGRFSLSLRPHLGLWSVWSVMKRGNPPESTPRRPPSGSFSGIVVRGGLRPSSPLDQHRNLRPEDEFRRSKIFDVNRGVETVR
ncbi:hypothetical protein CIHG_02373 [Coccidioides immitis H538.4]|nr:hypothetical protein CIRG_00540 [Coccidioides immitis RMSCC 2394]KMU76791.1 hypothetical protein CISG_05624 [Coccidioides immitis RMSCC 3703]KMU84589.1 hypothetical protein CIHG_02373 [Coccidioides immitis H538.4]